jgi:L-alanine-DL-glutamate epimerase-like enolase superfamily enzyme
VASLPEGVCAALVSLTAPGVRDEDQSPKLRPIALSRGHGRHAPCNIVEQNGKVWPNDRPGLGISVDEKQLTFIETMTEAAPGVTHRRLDGSLTHW